MAFNKGQIIGGYTITFPIKKGKYAQTFRVKDRLGKNYFMKVMNTAKLHRSQFDKNENILEIEILKSVRHDSIARYHDCGDFVESGEKYAYLVTDFVSGETVAEKVARETGASFLDAKAIALAVLEALKYLHTQERPILHNEVTPQNVMLDLSAGLPKPILIDFGHARFLDQPKKAFDRDGLNPFYMAPETYNGIFTPQSDIFSVGAMLYHLMFGRPPYYVDLSNHTTGEKELQEIMAKEREKPLLIPVMDGPAGESNFVKTIAKALALDVDERFKTADDFLKALNGITKVDAPQGIIFKDVHSQREQSKPDSSTKQKSEESTFKKLSGRGFADVGGMEELKEQIQSDFIEVLENAEEAKRLGVTIPNGMLLYGPPGCGKSYFSEKLAEELGWNYRCVHCSDLATPFIHGAQTNIANLFNEARSCAPSIICLEEIEALVMNRNSSKQNNVSESGEVNEFLVQLNNCGKDNVFVIGSTNNVDDIDPAALRSGRLEFHYYIGPPDKDAREKIFRIYLRDDIIDSSIDFAALAEKTEGYVSADIEKIFKTAGRLVLKRKERLYTQAVLEEAISKSHPSVTRAQIMRHEEIRDRLEGKTSSRTRIGFK